MTDSEWLACEDVRPMLAHLRSSWRGEDVELDRLLHRYLVACSRRLWELLPLEESRDGVEVTERFLDGQATEFEFRLAKYEAEAAALLFERWAEIGARIGLPFRDLEPERIARCIEAFDAIPLKAVVELIGPIDPDRWPTARELIGEVAHFAMLTLCFPGLSPKDYIESTYASFFSTQLLREMIDARREGPDSFPSEGRP